jgi:hypothetical protein
VGERQAPRGSSDLTFAVRKDGELVNIGKAYSGLTDVEIAR